MSETGPATSPRHFTVPEELAGTRVDAGLAKLMDISRSQAATLIAEGNVSSHGKAVGKSLKLSAGVGLDVVVPERRDPLEVVEEVVEGLKILLDDDEFVVVDSPLGSLPTRRRAGWGRRSSAASPAPATGSPPPVRPNVPASSTGSTSGPPALWWSPKPRTPTRRSSGPSRSAPWTRC